jgi:hypothetical protein
MIKLLHTGVVSFRVTLLCRTVATIVTQDCHLHRDEVRRNQMTSRLIVGVIRSVIISGVGKDGADGQICITA